MIWIIGGTSEAGEFIKLINGKADYLVTVATYSGKEVINTDKVVVARLNLEQMRNFTQENKISAIVDLTHPYAVEVSSNAKLVAKENNIEYLRYLRQTSNSKQALTFESIQECADFLSKTDATVFFTTGIKSIKDFEKVRGENRFIYRILPTTFSLEEAAQNKLNMRDIVAILGPVSTELNISLFKEYKADYVVMKDSGSRGGTPEKLEACEKLGITPLLIGREEEEGISSLSELLELSLKTQNNT